MVSATETGLSTALQDAFTRTIGSLNVDAEFRIRCFRTEPELRKPPFRQPFEHGVAFQCGLTRELVLASYTQKPNDALHEDEDDEVLFCALEVDHYTITATDPNDASVRDLVYIAKVDTSGYVPQTPLGTPTRPTRHLIEAYLSCLPPSEVYLFARAQPQYLFHASANNAQKRALNDRQLIRWWKDVLGSISSAKTERWWYIPGVDTENEAKSLISDRTAAGHWVYGYPYAKTDDAWTMIPRFPDDPKTRLLKSYAGNTTSKSEEASQSAVGNEDDEEEEEQGANSVTDEEEKPKTTDAGAGTRSDSHGQEPDYTETEPTNLTQHPKAVANPRVMSVHTFWELVSIGEECGAGRLGGFFAIKPLTPSTTVSRPSWNVTWDVFVTIWNTLMKGDFSQLTSAQQATQQVLKEAARLGIVPWKVKTHFNATLATTKRVRDEPVVHNLQSIIRKKKKA
ncbi:hypothetical protein BZG36_00810 [Bifiguratus adelaidae]|uniref:histone acetyltransferase n=1 Tax=Bifiguratus adelaidae TaxID=1938954 RepID=A0A261Y6R0_9FUNG|nr:hypothetical protein BZG36_00810 [Bifiguratus adelaidae]